jgi:hypothetical protein
MTKKHFEAIADILAETKPKNTNSKQHETWEDVTSKMVMYLQKQNPQFDTMRFFARCNGIIR